MPTSVFYIKIPLLLFTVIRARNTHIQHCLINCSRYLNWYPIKSGFVIHGIISGMTDFRVVWVCVHVTCVQMNQHSRKCLWNIIWQCQTCQVTHEMQVWPSFHPNPPTRNWTCKIPHQKWVAALYFPFACNGYNFIVFFPNFFIVFPSFFMSSLTSSSSSLASSCLP